MRKFYTLVLSILLLSCLSESNVDPGTSATFVRYYNGGNNDEAKAMEVTPEGGYALLATTRIQKAETDIPQFKIKFIKTDDRGNPIGNPTFYPPIDDASRNYQASSIARIPKPGGGGYSGYVIAGEDIQSDGSFKAVLIKISENGKVQNEQSFDYGRGRAVAATDTSFVMLTIQSYQNATDSMHLVEVDSSSLSLVPGSPTSYPAGQTTLSNKLLLDETGKAIWSGTLTNSGLTGIRVVKTVTTNFNTEFDRLVSQPEFNLVGSDICRYGLNYAVVGSTNRKQGVSGPAADTDILFVRMNALGDTLSTRSFPLGDLDNQNDTGSAINSTNDGGLILVSSVNSAAIKGRGDQDFYLIRIDAFGQTVWTSSFGSRFKDEAVAVRQATDGGYVLFGTTTQGSLKILTLLKTDKNGIIE